MRKAFSIGRIRWRVVDLGGTRRDLLGRSADATGFSDGQFGLNDDETGSDWHSVKQARMAPDLKSIGGDSEGIKPGGF